MESDPMESDPATAEGKYRYAKEDQSHTKEGQKLRRATYVYDREICVYKRGIRAGAVMG